MSGYTIRRKKAEKRRLAKKNKPAEPAEPAVPQSPPIYRCRDCGSINIERCEMLELLR